MRRMHLSVLCGAKFAMRALFGRVCDMRPTLRNRVHGPVGSYRISLEVEAGGRARRNGHEEATRPSSRHGGKSVSGSNPAGWMLHRSRSWHPRSRGLLQHDERRHGARAHARVQGCLAVRLGQGTAASQGEGTTGSLARRSRECSRKRGGPEDTPRLQMGRRGVMGRPPCLLRQTEHQLTFQECEPGHRHAVRPTHCGTARRQAIQVVFSTEVRMSR